MQGVSGVAPPPAGGRGAPAGERSGELGDKKLREACQELEAVFWHLLLRSMRKTIPEGELFERSSEEKIYLDMLDEQYAILLARQDAAGIGRILYEQLRRKGER
ncbi:MAG: rod-binding protein [Thermacetogeniaceae bacterium]